MHPRYALAALLLLVCTTSSAGVPSPGNSTVPDCLVACPQGDVEYRVLVRDIAGFPVVNCEVEIDLSSCPGLVLCPTQPTGLTWDPVTRRASALGDVNGAATFRFKMGGVCPTASIPVKACLVIIGTATAVASPDQNADLFVGGSDVLTVTGLIGTTNRGADFDCSGTVTAADLAFLTDLHGGHSCNPAAPTLRRSWGELKQHYR
jgi:hypothetical protein